MSLKDIASIIESYANRRPALKRRFERSKIWDLWERIVGKEIAKIAQPEMVDRENHLVIKVSDSIWMEQLFLERLKLLEKINAVLPKGLEIKGIRFRHGMVLPRDGRQGRRKTENRHFQERPSESLIKEAEEMTRGISDERLRTQLKKAYIAYKLRLIHLRK